MQKPLASGGKHGIAPEERDIKEHLRKGIIVIDKPRGPTSHQVSAWVRNLVGAEKAGHGGTLDPNVSGVLVIALDDALKALQVLLLDTKEYITTLKLHGQVDRKELESVIKEFTSEIYQTPPVRAAVKRERRARTVHEMEILDVVDRSVLFRAVCESGTYIRTLCVDMGDVLGVGGHMFELRRSRTAGFDESQLVTLHELKDAFVAYEEGDEKPLRKIVLPFERLLDHLPKVYVNPCDARYRDVSPVAYRVHGRVLDIDLGEVVQQSLERQNNFSERFLVAFLVCDER
ncbi:MAG: RNA-guided pseudouridylation complex pseudouridine synthase subunit Cbf5, partial [Candidatus Thermoplasmatota archaeon]|nr:RNA-guided pseudouridylation complex pseudouridine synthase subunit Cbf5 [Candidatus Thermoplasmatota archaeon]